MSLLSAALSEVADWTQCESLETFRSHIDPEWIERALEATGTATLRRRRLPAEQVLWLVLGMALCRNRPIHEVVSKLDLVLPEARGSTPVARSSVAQARQRVGAEPLRWLFEHSAERWALRNAQTNAWRGLSLFAMDGSTLRVADSDENRSHYGLADGGHRGKSGYPLVRINTLLAIRSHLILGAEFGPYARSEHDLSRYLWDRVPDRSLTIVDKNYLAARLLLGLQRDGTDRHWLVRSKKSTKWNVLKSFGRFDKLVELTVSSKARRKDAWLPKTFVARAISYRRKDSRERQWLLTSLTDAQAYPAAEMVDLYHERWEIELAYDELKTHMLEAEETIRSRTVEGVAQEIWGILLAYNLIRLEMAAIAAEAGVVPIQISFVQALRFIRDEWEWCAVASPGTIPKKLQDLRRRVLSFVLPSRRSERRFPRAVKIKMSNYAKKRRSTA